MTNAILRYTGRPDGRAFGVHYGLKSFGNSYEGGRLDDDWTRAAPMLLRAATFPSQPRSVRRGDGIVFYAVGWKVVFVVGQVTSAPYRPRDDTGPWPWRVDVKLDHWREFLRHGEPVDLLDIGEHPHPQAKRLRQNSHVGLTEAEFQTASQLMQRVWPRRQCRGDLCGWGMSEYPKPLERFLRPDELLLADETAVVRGGPIDLDEFRRNAEDTLRAYTWCGAPLIGVSVEVGTEEWGLERILSEGRVCRRATYSMCLVGEIRARNWQLLPSFSAPHYTLLLSGYTEAELHQLFTLFRHGERPNPYHR
ncbi:MAG: hypothetical protein ACRDZO_19105 [Egibacteraceae bacterium]